MNIVKTCDNQRQSSIVRKGGRIPKKQVLSNWLG